MGVKKSVFGTLSKPQMLCLEAGVDQECVRMMGRPNNRQRGEAQII